MITFDVPGQPQGKQRPRIGRVRGKARMFTPEATVAYEGLIAYSAKIAMAGRSPFQGPCKLVLGIYLQVPVSWSKKKRHSALAGNILPITKPDLDNVAKAVCDGINGVVWRDDSQLVDLKVTKRYSLTPGLVAGVEEKIPPSELGEISE